ncbi:hypothetical protein EIP91_004105 [Steccherinum ochraceum]|uniref:Protein kinase domain-containing protein n=1 Tax=Steccherinum ochraceum TaxID=92696 RepID=A0A4R0RPU7_9APHY|nr:hypothetical protein EIP91_004105 [Steccherinum ochraceum]
MGECRPNVKPVLSEGVKTYRPPPAHSTPSGRVHSRVPPWLTDWLEVTQDDEEAEDGKAEGKFNTVELPALEAALSTLYDALAADSKDRRRVPIKRELHRFIARCEYITGEVEQLVSAFRISILSNLLTGGGSLDEKHSIIQDFMDKISEYLSLGEAMYVAQSHRKLDGRNQDQKIQSSSKFLIRSWLQLLTKFNAALNWTLLLISEPSSSSRWFESRAHYIKKTLQSIEWHAHQYQTAMVVTRLLNATTSHGTPDAVLGQLKTLAYECCQYSPAWLALQRLAPNAWMLEKDGSWTTQKLLGTILLVLQEGIDANTDKSDQRIQARMLRTLVRSASQLQCLPPTYYLNDIRCDTRSGLRQAGGFGDVYQGRWRNDEMVALKVVRGMFGVETGEWLNPCIREIVMWRQLNHPNIQPFLGVNSSVFAPRVALVSKWERRGNVLSAIKSLDVPTLESLRCQWVMEMADGLEYLHNYDIVHGDVRGTNVLIDEDWHVRLTDFGLAVLADSSTPTNGAVAGLIPFAWAAPELVDETCKRPTFACDVFSFGRTCVEIYTGESPFGTHLSQMQIFKKLACGEQPPRPTRVATDHRTSHRTPSEDDKSDDVPNALWALLLHCWDRDPSKRPSMKSVALQAAEIDDDFEEALAREVMLLDPDPSQARRLARGVPLQHLEMTLMAFQRVVSDVPLKMTLETAVMRVEERVGVAVDPPEKERSVEEVSGSVAITVSRNKLTVEPAATVLSAPSKILYSEERSPSSGRCWSPLLRHLLLVVLRIPRKALLFIIASFAFLLSIYLSYHVRSISGFVAGVGYV